MYIDPAGTGALKTEIGFIYDDINDELVVGRARLTEQATPATPIGGFATLFANSVGTLSGIDDAGVVRQMVRYEEGTFVPSFVGLGTAGTFTYAATNGGRYTRIGNLCLYRFRCQITATSVAPTGDLTISGLPFTSTGPTTDVAGGTALLQWTGITFTAGMEYLSARVASGEIRMRLVCSDSAGGAAAFLQGGGLAAVATVMGVGFYEVVP